MKLRLTLLSLAATAAALNAQQPAMSPATGDQFSIAMFEDIHVENNLGVATTVPTSWRDAVSWLKGENGRGPSGTSAITRWNIKAIGGIGDYVTQCNRAAVGQYTSGITTTGTAGQTGNLASFNGGGTGSTATVVLTGTNTIAGGTPLSFAANVGSGYTSTPTTATASSGTATCSGTATVVTSFPTGVAPTPMDGTFLKDYQRISSLGLPGVWPRGNHDACTDYFAIFPSSRQSSTLDVATSIGTVKLGFLGVDVADDMASGQAARTYVDGVIAAGDAHRQWWISRHVMTYTPSNPIGTGLPGWSNSPGFCSNNTECAGYVAPLDGVSFRDNFLVQEPRIFWAFGGHNGYITNIQTTANDGHVINTTGNLGASGSVAGWITIFKFKPATGTVDVQAWVVAGSTVGVGGTTYTETFTWTWVPDVITTPPPISGVSVRGITNTQAVIDYTAPDTSACTVEVSESNSYAPLVHDVDTVLFTGSNSDGGGPVGRTFVAGKRITSLGSDSRRYSRALQAYTQHYFRITCGVVTATGTFTTANIPFQVTYQDIPQMNTAGSNFMPSWSSTSRTETVIDPHTGAQLFHVSIPADTASDGGGGSGPFMYSGGFTRVCYETLITPASGPPGYFCSFPQGNGGQGVFYFIVPSTREARYLGKASWTGYPFMNSINGKIYSQSGQVVTEYTYSGTYAAAAPGTVASFTTVTIISNLATAITAFDAAFSGTYFGCAANLAMGDYIAFPCQRNGQDSYGWMAAVQISTKAVVAATRVDSNIKTRWCGIHAFIPAYDQAAVQIETHGLVGGSFGGSSIGFGPYRTTYSGGSTLTIGSTALAVAGEPACAGCGADSQVALALAGDKFHFADNGEVVTLVTKISPTSWTISATTQVHAAGTAVEMDCNYTPTYWKFLADPHGTDTTSTNYISNTSWIAGGHDDMTTGQRITENDGWPIQTGSLLSSLNLGPTRTVSAQPTFAGALAHCYGNGCKRHPSAGIAGGNWFTDYEGWDGSAYYSTTLTPITGNLYKYGTGPEFPLLRKYFATAAGQWSPYLDISGPGVVMATDTTDNYKFCVANLANECRSGAVKGDIYVNLPTNPGNCASSNSSCIVNMNSLVQNVLQIGSDGTHTRTVTGGLVGFRNTNDYPTAKTLPDGSGILFTIGNFNGGQSYLVLAKLPPFTAADSTDRTKFISKSITLTTPGGVGATRAAIKMGYLEQGGTTQYYCTSRRESCVVTSTAVPPVNGTTDPFWYQTTDTWTGTGCLTSCTIILPVLPLHIAYYQPIFLDDSGNIVATGTAAITGDFVAATIPPPPSTGLFLLPSPIAH